jgi:hypothetical protein
MSSPKYDTKTSSEESLSSGEKEGGVLNPAVQLEFLLYPPILKNGILSFFLRVS